MSAVDFLVEHCGVALLRPVHFLAATMYLYGPAAQVAGIDLGFWQGRSAVDICSTMTGAPSDLWWAHPAACHHLIAQRFFSYYYAAFALLVVWAVASCGRGCLSLCNGCLALAASSVRRRAALE
jgi:hypothetical protein